MTIGTGVGVVHGLAHSIATQNPDKLLPLVSSESAANLDELLSVSPGSLSVIAPVVMRDVNDLETSIQDARSALAQLVADGFPTSGIGADFTSGTKVMTAALCIAATSIGVHSLSYVSGRRDQSTGRVLSGTERLLCVYPVQEAIDRLRSEMILHFNSHRFSRVAEVARDVQQLCLSPEVQHEFRAWERVALVYDAWDRFQHSDAAKLMRALTKDQICSLGCHVDTNKRLLFQIERQLNKAAEAEDVRERLGAKYCVEILADLLANADRRAAGGRYDDAVARLYRATEFVAQHGLAGYGIDSAAVASGQVPASAREFFPEFCDREQAAWSQGTTACGLDRAFRLLLASATSTWRARTWIAQECERRLPPGTTQYWPMARCRLGPRRSRGYVARFGGLQRLCRREPQLWLRTDAFQRLGRRSGSRPLELGRSIRCY